MKKQPTSFNQLIVQQNCTKDEALKLWEFLRASRVTKLLDSMVYTIKPKQQYLPI